MSSDTYVADAKVIESFLDASKKTDIPVVSDGDVVLIDCPECGKTCNGNNGLMLHKTVHETADCKYCGETFNQHGVYQHERVCKSEKTKIRSEKAKAAYTQYRDECEVCHKMIGRQGMVAHLKKHERDGDVDFFDPAEDVIEKIAIELFGKHIPINKIPSLLAWMEMTEELQKEMIQ